MIVPVTMHVYNININIKYNSVTVVELANYWTPRPGSQNMGDQERGGGLM